MKPNYMIVYMKENNSFFRQDYVFGEIAARKEAHRLFTEGFVYVELLKRSSARRGGFERVQKVDRR